MKPFRFGCLSMQPLAAGPSLAERARSAEGSGFSTFQVSDHFDRSPFAPLLALATAAAATTTLRLGTLVLDNDFRHPAVLAKELATLDVLSGGRLEVGLGAGWMRDDYDVSGIDCAAAGERIDKLASTIELLSSVLADSGPVTLSGKHFHVSELRSVPQPAARPPLLVGGGRKRILSLAASTADIVSVNTDVSEGRVGERSTRSAFAGATDEKLGWVRAAASDRDPELHLMAYWCAVTDDPVSVAAERIRAAGLELEPADLLASPHCLIGPLPQLVERLHERRERWGFSYVTFYDHDAAAMAPLVSAMEGI